MTIYDRSSVEYESDTRKNTLDRYRLIDALEGGTQAMLDGGLVTGATSYLPSLPSETAAAYNLRCQLAELESVYSDTLDKLAGKPFSQPIVFENAETLDPRLAELEHNADGEGTDVTSWGRQVFREGLHRGLTFVLVDMPAASPDAATVNGVTNLATERETMVPRWIHVSPLDLIGWRESPRTPNSPPELEQVRIKTSRTEADGDYGEIVYDVIRVITQTTFEVWERERPRVHSESVNRAGQVTPTGVSEQYQQVASGSHTFGEVPLYPFYVDKIGSMLGRPALTNLADANLGHFVALSTHNLLIEHARRNLLFGAGFKEDELKAVTWSASTVIATTNHEAKLETVGYQGTAHEASFHDLDRRERRMRALGAAPMEPRNANTATEVLSDENGSTTSLQAWAVRFGRFIGTLVDKSNQAIGSSTPVSEDFRAKIFDDFAINIDSATDGQLLLSARDASEISQATLLQEFKRRSIISDGVDIEAEITRTDEEKAEAAAQAEDTLRVEAEIAAAGGDDSGVSDGE